MARIIIKKGHNIQISGVPSLDLVNAGQTVSVAYLPEEFRYIKPKLLVNEGDTVKIGTPLFFDKKIPDVKWAALGSGKISAIHYGQRRVIEKIIIVVDKNEETLEHAYYDHQEITNLTNDQVKDQLLNAGMWPLIRQRPFNKIANPRDLPDSIFISCYNSAPLSVDLDVALRNRRSSFQAGITALSKLTEGKVNVVVDENSTSDTFKDLQHAETHLISGPHPAGNVGIQIHNINPLTPRKVIWTVNVQHVVTIGRLFLKGIFDPSLIIAIGGPGVKNPIHLKSRMGASIQSLVTDRLHDVSHRMVSGDVLTGSTVDKDDFIHYYNSAVASIPHSDKRTFLGMLHPGSSKSHYSLTHTYFKFGTSTFPFSTLQNGEERAMLPINTWENVLPMDILPNQLYRAIIANDIEEMEQLGLIECDEEDFALCSFSCPSKIDVGNVIRQGLDMLEAEV